MISLEQIRRYFVAIKGNQVIDGIKRFLQFPFTPHAEPEENYHVVNKKYCDDSVASLTMSNNLLDGNHHQDTTASAAVRGHIIAANATPEWDVVSIGLAAEFLRSDGTDPAWTSVAWTDISGAALLSTWIGSVSNDVSTNTEYIVSVSNAASTKISGSLSTWISSLSTSISNHTSILTSLSADIGAGGGLDVNLSNIATSVSISASIYIENDLEITGDFICESSSKILCGSASVSGTWFLARASNDWVVYRISTSGGGIDPYEKWRFTP